MTTYTTVATALTNSTSDSNIDVFINDSILRWEVLKNLYQDQLPIIPRASRVEHGNVLYRLNIKVTISKLRSNEPLPNIPLTFQSNRLGDILHPLSSVTDTSGNVFVTLDSRRPGSLQLSAISESITAQPLSIKLDEAWYESDFEITHYIIADERDSKDELTVHPGLPDMYRKGFLYGATGVSMQGTGQAINGKYIRFNGGGGGWHRNEKGNPDILNHPESAILAVADGAHGRFADVVANRSIAIDPKIIPGLSRVHIESINGARIIGERHADDTGGAIRNYHIDHFCGLGMDASRKWAALGGDIKNARVKFLGKK